MVLRHRLNVAGYVTGSKGKNMTRGLRWGVPVGVVAGVLTIVVLDVEKIHGQLGGVLAAAVTGIVIFVVSRAVDRTRR